MFRLFTIYWPVDHADRRAELDFCLKVNMSTFDALTVLAQDSPRPDWYAGQWFEGNRRQEYCDLFALAYFSQPHDINIIANSDIVFTRDQLQAIEDNLKPSECYCLTRWDMYHEGGIHLFETATGCSQDSWIFRGPPKVDGCGRFRVGDPGCDNRLGFELRKAGYTVLNPARSIQSVHYHRATDKSGEVYRTANIQANRVPLPYLTFHPHKLGEQPTYHQPLRLPKRAGFHRV